jgi:hypothetical protein
LQKYFQKNSAEMKALFPALCSPSSAVLSHLILKCCHSSAVLPWPTSTKLNHILLHCNVANVNFVLSL